MKRPPFVPPAYYVAKRPSRHLLKIDFQRLAELALSSARRRLARRVGAWRGKGGASKTSPTSAAEVEETREVNSGRRKPMKSPTQPDEKLLNLARATAKIGAASFAAGKLPGRWIVVACRWASEVEGKAVYLLAPEIPDVDLDDPDVPLPGWARWEAHVAKTSG